MQSKQVNSTSPHPLTNVPSWKPPLQPQIPAMDASQTFIEGFIKGFTSDTSCSGKDLEDFLASVMPDTSPACQVANEDATHASGSGMEAGSVKVKKRLCVNL